MALNPLKLDKNARPKLPRELEGEAKIAAKYRLVAKALDDWEVFARDVARRAVEVANTIDELRTEAARAGRERGESTRTKAIEELMAACDKVERAFNDLG